MTLELMTVVWGSKHIELFKRTCLKSLAFPKNKEALVQSKAIWNIFTDDDMIKRVEDLIRTHHPEIRMNIKSKKDLRNYIDPVQSATIWQIEECIKTGSRLLLAPPDTIFGDGSIHNLIIKGEAKHSVVVVAHPRVLPSITADLSMLSDISNPKLVSLSWKHLHRAWTEARIGCVNQSSYVGGVEWQEIEPNLYEVIHRLPSPYLMDFIQDDLDYFKSAISFGHFDHVWPGDKLVAQGRQVNITHSDEVFICEVTDADKNVPPIIPGQPASGFWRNHPHNIYNEKIKVYFKGE